MKSRQIRQILVSSLLCAMTTTFLVVSNPVSASTVPIGRVDHNIAQVWVGDGCFTMGAKPNQTEANFSNAHPQHEVCLTSDFWLDKFDVTNAAYGAFVDAGGYSNPIYWSHQGWAWLQVNHISGPQDFPHFDAPDQPRVGVSWYEAQAYATWRGGSLPTEAQWEYAARGPQGSNYPWGDTYVFGKANIDERPDGSHYVGHTTPVGGYAEDRSWDGAYDMAGNVWQWTADWYQADAYSQSVKDNPTGPTIGDFHVLRGGAWGFDEDCATASYRYHAKPDTRSETI